MYEWLCGSATFINSLKSKEVSAGYCRLQHLLAAQQSVSPSQAKGAKLRTIYRLPSSPATTARPTELTGLEVLKSALGL